MAGAPKLNIGLGAFFTGAGVGAGVGGGATALGLAGEKNENGSFFGGTGAGGGTSIFGSGFFGSGEPKNENAAFLGAGVGAAGSLTITGSFLTSGAFFEGVGKKENAGFGAGALATGAGFGVGTGDLVTGADFAFALGLDDPKKEPNTSVTGSDTSMLFSVSFTGGFSGTTGGVGGVLTAVASTFFLGAAGLAPLLKRDEKKSGFGVSFLATGAGLDEATLGFADSTFAGSTFADSTFAGSAFAGSTLGVSILAVIDHKNVNNRIISFVLTTFILPSTFGLGAGGACFTGELATFLRPHISPIILKIEIYVNKNQQKVDHDITFFWL